VLGALTAGAHAQSSGNWTMKAPVPAALNEVTVAYAAGKLHVMGGSVLGFTGPYHQEYDPTTDKWRARSPLPRALDRIGSAVTNGKIYAIGGFVGGACCTRTARTRRSSMTRRSTPGASWRR
jgi:hypothetical protein